MTTEFQAAETDTLNLCVETVRVRILQESFLQPCDSGEPPARGFDPYNTDIGALTTSSKPRKSLDDVRRLSEAIKRNRVRSR